jgi:hypothetical protein
MPTDPQNILETALPFVAYLVSYIIQQAHWLPKTNATVAGVTVILAAVGSLFVQHKITGNILADFLAVAAFAAGLQTEALKPLSQWLRGNVASVSNSSAESSNTPPQQVER